MSNLPAIAICTAAVVTNVNRVWEEGLLRGPNNLSRKLCPIDPLATHETPATHYMMQDMSAQDTDVAVWQGLCAGNLPEGVSWGEFGIISGADAIAACGGGNMQVYSAAGLETSEQAADWREGVLLGVGLQFVPDEPI